MRSSLKNYGLGIVAVALAVLLRWVLDPLMGDAFPLVTLFGAVAAAVWLGGYRVAIPVTLIGYIACHYLFIEPRGDFDLTECPKSSRADCISLHLCSDHRFRRSSSNRSRPGPPSSAKFSELRCEVLAMQ